MANIGEPLRIHEIEPLKIPVEPNPDVVWDPTEVPEEQPAEEVPAYGE